MYPSTHLSKPFMGSRIFGANANTLQYNQGPSRDLETFAYHCRIFANTTPSPILRSQHAFLACRISRAGFRPKPQTSATTLPNPPLVLHSPVPDRVFVNVPFWLSEDCNWEAEVDFSASISIRPAIGASVNTTEEPTETEYATDDTDSTGTSSSPFSSPSPRYSSCSMSSLAPTSYTTSISACPSPDIALPTPTYNAQPDISEEDAEALRKASQLAERIIELDNMEDSEAKAEEMQRLFKTWEPTYAQVKKLVDGAGGSSGAAKK